MKRTFNRSVHAAIVVATTVLAIGCSAPTTAGPDANTAAEPAAADTSAKADIVDTAVGAGSFGTLVAAVKAADMVDVLKGDGPFTVFAPTDDAFAKLPPGTVDDLLKPENKAKLQAVLKYHVVAGRVGSEAVVGMSEAETVEGSMLRITVGDDGVMVDEAKVIKTDIDCTNGVIHVIDSVVLPAG